MNAEQIARAARILHEARTSRRLIEALPDDCAPTTAADAHRIAARVVELSGERPVGYLVGATNPYMLETLGLKEPYFARILESNLHRSPMHRDGRELLTIDLECEVAFTMARDLPARAEPYSEAEVADAIAAMHPSVEVVNAHFTDWLKKPFAWVLADNGTDGPLVLGSAVEDWRGIDRPSIPVTLTVNGAVVSQGRGANAMGDPFAVMVWLANKLRAAGSGLKAGEVVNTGTCATLYPAKAGDKAVADFGPLGRVEMDFAG